jgi:hypothetical protein
MADWLERISPSLRIVGGEAAPVGWREALRTIYDHELVLFRGSDFETEFLAAAGERQRVVCPAGSFIIVPPGLWHASRNVSDREGFRTWVHFDWVCAGDRKETPVMTYAPARPQRGRLRRFHAPKYTDFRGRLLRLCMDKTLAELPLPPPIRFQRHGLQVA